MRFIELEQGSQEWHDYRKNRLGASVIPIIMGVSPWCTKFQLWSQMLGITQKEETNERQRHGHNMEPVARAAFEKEVGIKVTPAVVQHPSVDYLMASLDGLSDDHRTCVEIKNVNRKDHEEALNGRIPEKYWPQVQSQLFCTGLGEMYYYSYQNDSTALVLVKRDEGYIISILKEAEDFMNCLNTFSAPDMTDRDYQVKHGREWEDKVREWRYCKEMADEYKASEDLMRKDLIKMANGQSSVGGGVKLTKYSERGRINYDSIPQLQGVDLNSFRKEPVEKWRVSEI